VSILHTDLTPETLPCLLILLSHLYADLCIMALMCISASNWIR